MTDYKQAYEKLLKEKVMLMKKLRERRQEILQDELAFLRGLRTRIFTDTKGIDLEMELIQQKLKEMK